MKKISLVTAVCLIALTLVSCGKKATDSTDVVVTPTTDIESKEQAAKVCAPFIEYLECSLGKAPEAKKDVHSKIIEDTKRKIENDDPARIAQQCDTYIKILKENPEISFKNGCTINDGTAPTPTTTTTPEAKK